MMSMQLSEAADLLQAQRSGPDAWFTGISTDTRTLARENLFFALVGPRFDGNGYVEQARSKGAAAAVVSAAVTTTLPLLQVADTKLALGQLARHWRARFTIPVVGITGSNGKTTVKEMIAAILACQGPVHATKGNLNNDIGVPLTLAGLNAEHCSAVIEMGANHAGEIAYLAGLTHPTVGIVTNAGPAHLEGFGSIEGVAHAKGEMFKSLGTDGVAIINADDHYAPLWQEFARGRRVMTFGLQSGADVTANHYAETAGTLLELRTPQGQISVHLPLLGMHNVVNALGATAAALAAGANLEQVQQGLESLGGVSGRLQRKQRRDGGLIIDDTYNANPASMRAAIDVLQAFPGERWLVLGDMGELGDDAEAMHAEVGTYAAQAGIDKLFALGDLASHAARACGSRAQAFAELGPLLAALEKDLRPDISILVKGSRSMGMERVVQALTGAAPGGHA